MPACLHLAGGIPAEDIVESLRAEEDVLESHGLPGGGEDRLEAGRETAVGDAQAGESVQEVLQKTSRGCQDIGGVVQHSLAAHVEGRLEKSSLIALQPDRKSTRLNSSHRC